tara:strand:+ start:5010 stop:5216 length:207 start_codon:yes stop_codon:yes gene_type:complete
MATDQQGVNRVLSPCGNHPEPPRQCGCLGEQMAAIALSLLYAEQERSTAAEQWARARTIAAKKWRGNR